MFTLTLCLQGVDLLVLGIVAYSAIGALNPKSPTFSEANQRDVRKRPAGAPLAFGNHAYGKPVCSRLMPSVLIHST